MPGGRGVLVFDNISSYSLAEENGAGHPFNNSWHHIELESGPIWVTAASALERRAVHIDGDNAAIVSECIHHNTMRRRGSVPAASVALLGRRGPVRILIRRALLFGPRVGLNVIHHHTSKNRIFRLDQI